MVSANLKIARLSVNIRNFSADMESEKACNERDRQGETGPPTDNDCAEWAVPSNWVVCLVNVCADQKANTTAVPATCLPNVSEGRGISQTEGQARAERFHNLTKCRA